MPWYFYLLQFFAGMLLTNALPHLVAGLQGAKFQSPFAKPPGVGESSALSNVYWGFANLVGGVALLAHFGPASLLGWLVVLAGGLAIGTQLSIYFGKIRHGS
jgi:hypothetical protein